MDEAFPGFWIARKLWREELQGDGASELGVFSLVHNTDTSAALAELLEDVVVWHRLANHTHPRIEFHFHRVGVGIRTVLGDKVVRPELIDVNCPVGRQQSFFIASSCELLRRLPSYRQGADEGNLRRRVG